MAKIREYENEMNIKPSDRGTDALANEARAAATTGYHIGQQIKQTGNEIEGSINIAGHVAQNVYDKYVVKDEISKGAPLASGILDGSLKEWNELAKTNPNDTSIDGKFKEGLEKKLEQFKSGFSTKEGQLWAEGEANRIRQHFNEKTAADMSYRAGQGVVQRINTTGNQLSTAVSRDPTSLDTALGLVDSSIEVQVANQPNLSAHDAATVSEQLKFKTKQELVKTALTAMIDANPEAGLKAVSSGKYSQYIEGSDIKQFGTYARVISETQRTQAEHAATIAKRKKEEDGKSEASNIMADTLTVDERGTVHLDPSFFERTIGLAKKGYDPNLGRSMLAAGRAIVDNAAKGEKDVTDGNLYNDFSSRMFLKGADGGLTVQEVYKAKADRLLSDNDFRFFEKAVSQDVKNAQSVADRKLFDEQFIKAYKSYITKSTIMTNDGPGEQRLAEFTRDKWQQFQAGRAAGMKVQELLNANSPNFLGRDLDKYQSSADDAINNTRGRVTGRPTPLPPVYGANPAPNKNPGQVPKGNVVPEVTGAVAPPPGPSQADQDWLSGGKPAIQWKSGESMDDLAKRLNGGK